MTAAILGAVHANLAELHTRAFGEHRAITREELDADQGCALPGSCSERSRALVAGAVRSREVARLLMCSPFQGASGSGVHVNNHTLTSWLNDSFQDAATAYSVTPKDFWPSRPQATTLSWAIVLRAAHDTHGAVGPLDVCTTFHGKKHRSARRALLNKLWFCHGHTLTESHVMLDFSVHRWAAPQDHRVMLTTAESEMHPVHGTGMWDGYGWDFYKLMHVPSPLRLFVCRVGSSNGISGSVRRDNVQRLLEDHMRRHAIVREDRDDIGIVILPCASRAWRDTRLWSSGDRRWDRPWAASPP